MTFHFQPPRNVAQRNLIAVCVGAFFASLGFSIVTPLMPLFTLELLDGDLAAVAMWVGIAIGVSPLLTALSSPWWGALGDRFGQKIMIQRSLLSIGAAIGLMAIISHPGHLVGLRAIIGVLGGISVACLAAVTSSSSKQVLGRNIGLLQAAQTLGMVAGPLVGGGLALAAGMRPTFVIASSLFALGFGLVTWLYRNVAVTAVPRARAGEPASASTVERPAAMLFWATLAVLFSANFIDGSFMVLLPLYLPLIGAPLDSLSLVAGLGLSGGALAMALSAAVAGRLTARYSSQALILTMLSGGVLALVCIILTSGWWQFLALRVVLGLMAGGLPTVAYASAAALVPPERRGAVVGTASSAGLVGWAAAPMLVGFLVSVDPRAVFVMDALLLTLCGVALSWAGGARRWRDLPGAARARLAALTR